MNSPVREYGFTINLVNNLPTVGVIDSGISMRTPLAPIIIVDEDLNTTSTSVIDDNISGGQGHGTAVGGLVALGEEGINSNYRGNLSVHCMLLPVKIIDENNKYLFISSIIDVLYKTKKKHPYVKIFTLTVNFEVHKLFNENYSNYAYALDKFSFENDCLIFISTGNNSNAINRYNNYDLAVFNEETSNINVPAESLNNMTVGACANSFKQGDFAGISDGKEFPTMYSRRGHYNYALLNKGEKVNKLLFKPDLIMAGGDYCFHRGFITFEGNASMTVISADPTESFYNQVGTSFAAPLAANIAVRLQRLYPNVKATTLKALMINHCTDNLVAAENKQLLIGHGNIDVNKVLYSDENKITFIIEETIDNEQIKTYPITLPSYLYNDDLGKVNGILKVTGTLCYNFSPIKDNQLGYCPVNIAMGFFRDHEHAEILEKEENIRSKFKNSLPLWTQNSRYKTKPIPFSNVQKVSFPINVSEIKEDNGIFKLGVHCFVHPQLRPGESNIYLKDNRFSIILTVEETLRQEKVTGKLYDEIIAVNDVSQLIDVEGIAELEN